MIDFKNKDELPTNVVICGSLAVCVIAGACFMFLPKPKPPTASEQLAAQTKIKKATAALDAAFNSARDDLSKETWAGKPEDVGPIALKQVNALLLNRHLKLVGFHAQKTIEQPNVTLIPFIVSVDGGFTNVMQFTRDLEKTGTKLVVNQFQVANADQTTDKVTASIGITAYQLPPVSPVSPPTQTAPPAAKPQNATTGAKKNA